MSTLPKCRSPIEMMVDRACGLPAEDLEDLERNPSPQVLDHETQALLSVADAAKAWHLDPSDSSVEALHTACAEWVALGG